MESKGIIFLRDNTDDRQYNSFPCSSIDNNHNKKAY
jgi:hypothetical protein